ncbi:MAG: hypothetical protein KDK90_26335 [Leptospiraceae bacterium]|nr:hypothetical protein [Leptospiraceae bacterium]
MLSRQFQHNKLLIIIFLFSLILHGLLIKIYIELKNQKEPKNTKIEDIIMKIEIPNNANNRDEYETDVQKYSEIGNNISWNKNVLKFQQKLYETSVNNNNDVFKDPLNPYDSFTDDLEKEEVTLYKLSEKINKNLDEPSHDLANFGVWKIEWIKNRNQRDANAEIISKFRNNLSDEEYKSLCLQIKPFCKRKKRTLDFISREILSSDPKEEQDKIDEFFNCIIIELDSIDRPDLDQNPKTKCRVYWLKHMESHGLNLKRCGLFGNTECF